MVSLTTGDNTMIDSVLAKFEGAYAPNTIRSYRSDYMHYSNWCQEYNYDPFNIHEEQFADYILQMGESLTIATIQRRVASLSSIFSLTKSTNPTKEPVVILTFKKLRRKFGKPQKQATPLTYDILTKLKDVCSDDIVGLRNKLLLQLGYKPCVDAQKFVNSNLKTCNILAIISIHSY